MAWRPLKRGPGPACRAIATCATLLASLSGQTHSTPMAGRWFPAAPDELRSAVSNAMTIASKRAGAAPARRGLAALVVPHAAIQYSGVAAAAAYRLVDSPKNIILLGFSHREPIDGVVAPNIDVYRSPAGDIRVNRAAVKALGFPMSDEKRLCDHSLENQLPFLGRDQAGTQVIPLYVGSLDQAALHSAAQRLAARVRRGDLLMASSDFTHYGDVYGHKPFPLDQRLPERLRQRAQEAFEEIGSLNVEAFDRYLERTGDTICGRDPIRLLMATLAATRGDFYMNIADYFASGELTRDYSTSVGYGALAFYPSEAFEVDPAGQKQLLKHSRAALEGHFSGEAPPKAGVGVPDLSQRTGVFVTIRKEKELRGCVGTLAPRQPLLDTVADRTLAAAKSDPRFKPLSREEGPVSLEVSLLTPLKRIHDWRGYREGLGAVLMLESQGGLLLPQVAKEMGWNARQFLEGLSRKAGLPAAAYRDPRAKLYVFRAQAFGE